MSPEDAATALIEWVTATVPEITSAYDVPPTERTLPLPAVDCEIDDINHANAQDPELDLEQVRVRIYTCSLNLAVTPEPVRDASFALYGYADTLGLAAEADETLGGRFLKRGSDFSFHFDPVFFEFEDSTRARLATMHLTVASRL